MNGELFLVNFKRRFIMNTKLFLISLSFLLTSFCFAGQIHDLVRTGTMQDVKDLIKKHKNNKKELKRLMNVKDENGNTALHIFILIKDNEMAEIALENGANPNAQNNDGNTPSHYAAYTGNLEAAKLLKEHGAKINSKDKYGNRPLHIASLKGHESLVTFYIENGAEIDATNEFGWTALHDATFGESIGVVKIFIRHRANLDIKNDDGHNPLRLANNKRYVLLANLLREAKNNKYDTSKCGSAIFGK